MFFWIFSKNLVELMMWHSAVDVSNLVFYCMFLRRGRIWFCMMTDFRMFSFLTMSYWLLDSSISYIITFSPLILFIVLSIFSSSGFFDISASSFLHPFFSLKSIVFSNPKSGLYYPPSSESWFSIWWRYSFEFPSTGWETSCLSWRGDLLLLCWFKEELVYILELWGL